MHPRLSRFKVDNFKSLVNVAVDPTGLNLLVGSNNAGKTNLCHAMRFLSLTSKMSLMEASRQCTSEPWNLANVYLDKPTVDLRIEATLIWDAQPYSFQYVLSVTAPRIVNTARSGVELLVQDERLAVTGGSKFADTLLIKNHEGSVELLHEKGFAGEQVPARTTLATTAPRDHTMLFRLYDLQTNQLANLFKRYLSSWRYFCFDALRLREATARPLDWDLAWDGANLASVLYTLKTSDERLYRTIVETVKLVEPKLDVINFQSPDPEHVYMFLEDVKGKKFSASNVSDGTLRYLALCTVVALSRRAGAESGAPPLIIVEEPENGLYVGHLKPVFGRLDPTGASGQFLFTSHAPYFIDLFDGNLEGVLVARSNGTHTSISRPDIERVRKNLETFALGEMHFRDMLQ